MSQKSLLKSSESTKQLQRKLNKSQQHIQTNEHSHTNEEKQNDGKKPIKSSNASVNLLKKSLKHKLVFFIYEAKVFFLSVE